MRDRKLRVLLVEDNPADAYLFCERFSHIDGIAVDVQQVGSLREALHASKAGTFDLTVLDLNLPDSTGLATLRRFRRDHNHGAVVVLTGLAGDELSDLTRDEDVQDIIRKDEPSDLLLARGLLYAVERHHAQVGRRQLEKLVAYNPDAVLVVDDEGVVRFVNEAALELFGRSREDFVGELLGFSIPEGEMTEIEIIRPDGLRTAAMHVVHFDWEGTPATLASIRDVTATKQLNEQLRQAHKMEAIGRLAGGVAHDFNNLLTIILGYTNYLLGNDVDRAKLQDHLGEVGKAGERAAALIRQLLLYSRSAGSSPVPVSLSELVGDLENMLQRLIGEDIQLVVNTDSDLWGVVADQTQIEQVVMNMAVNARDAMPSGGHLIIETWNTVLSESQASPWFDVGPGEYAVLSISDTGEGMEQSTVTHIFDPFYTTKDVGKGTGLGLATSYGIIKQSGGHIDVSSEPGRGTTFRVYLPRDDQVDRTPRTVVATGDTLTGRETVLLVEDDEGVRGLTSLTLESQGYTVLEAVSGPQAIHVVEQHEGRIDLLLTDVVMPRMSGPQLVEVLRKSHPQLRVLFMSGYAGEATHSFARIPRDAELIDKPFTPTTLAGKVRSMLDRNVVAGLVSSNGGSATEA